VLAALSPRLLYHDILSVAPGPGPAPCYVDPGLGAADSNSASGGDGPSSQALCAALVLLLTSNTLFLHAAEHWRRCDAYFWLLRQIAHSSFEAREVMVQRDVLVQLVDLVIGDLSPVCGLLYAKGTRKRAPTSFVSVVPDKTGALPKHALPTSLPDFTDLFHLLADLVTSCATDPMLSGRGGPPSFANMSHSGYAGEAVDLNTLQTRQAAFSLHTDQHQQAAGTGLPPPPPPSGHFNANEKSITHEALYSTALKQARYVPPLLRMVTHQAFESPAFSADMADLFVRTISFAGLGETAHCFEAIAAFLQIEDSLSAHRAQQLLEEAGGLFAVLRDLAFTSKNPHKVCVCLTSLLAILHATPAARTAISTPRTKISSWAVWMLKFCHQFAEKARKEDQMALALAISANVADSSAGAPVDEEAMLRTLGPFLRVHGEEEGARECSWTQRSRACFLSLQSLLRGLGEEPDALIPMDAFEDYDAPSSSSLAAVAAAPAEGPAPGPVTASVLNANNKRNVTDLTVGRGRMEV
jgi:hypothetical protein